MNRIYKLIDKTGKPHIHFSNGEWVSVSGSNPPKPPKPPEPRLVNVSDDVKKPVTLNDDLVQLYDDAKFAGLYGNRHKIEYYSDKEVFIILCKVFAPIICGILFFIYIITY